ncbi:hypothetical protein [Streptomyces cyaneofuscatus]|uniref:hypothetical protein n=1 Tax=Streptomyces cyaneofuscatus TaxID=66883 RepID=UPI0036DB983E
MQYPEAAPQDQKAPRQHGDDQSGNSAKSQHQDRQKARQAATERQDPQLATPLLNWKNAAPEALCYAHQEISMNMLIKEHQMEESGLPTQDDLSAA